jgi:hypothetical protein
MAVRTAEPGKARAGIAAIKVALRDFSDDRSDIPILLLESSLINGQEPLEMMEKHPAEDHAPRMARAIDSRRIGNADSISVPGAPEGR